MGLLPEHVLGGVTVSELDVHPLQSDSVGTGPYRVAGLMNYMMMAQLLSSFRFFHSITGKSQTLVKFASLPTPQARLWRKIVRCEMGRLEFVKVY